MKNRIFAILSFLMVLAIATPAHALVGGPVAATVAAASFEVASSEAGDTDTKTAPEVKSETPAKEPLKPAEITSDEDASSMVKQLLAAAQGGKWNAVIAIVIMLLVFLVNRVPAIKAKVGAKGTPWLAAGTGILSYIAASLMVDGTSLFDAISGGFMVGAGAVGFWEMLFKHLLKSGATATPASS